MSKLFDLATQINEGTLDHVHIDGEKVEISNEYYYDRGFGPLVENHFGTRPVSVNGLVLSIVDSYGGEGSGEDYYYVVHDSIEGSYVKVSGYYSSWDGTDWEAGDLVEVVPKEVLVTQYVKK